MEDKKYEKLRLHFVYMFVVFVLFVAFLMSDKWTGQANFTEYLTNIGTFVSLVLGIVAIFYSFVSNSSFSQSLGSINSVSDNLIKTKVAIEEVISRAEELEKSAENNGRSLRDISDAVDLNIKSLNSTLENIGEKTELLHKAVETIPERFDKLEFSIAEAAKKEKEGGGERSSSNKKIAPEWVRSFLNYSSITGRYLIFSCVLAHKSKKTIDVDIISGVVESSVEYLYGYLIATIATDLIDATKVGGNVHVRNIVNVNENVINEIESIMMKYINSTYKADPAGLEKSNDIVSKLRKLFSEE